MPERLKGRFIGFCSALFAAGGKSRACSLLALKQMRWVDFSSTADEERPEATSEFEEMLAMLFDYLESESTKQ